MKLKILFFVFKFRRSVLKNSTFVDIKQRSGSAMHCDELIEANALTIHREDKTNGGLSVLGTTFRNANDCLPWSADVSRKIPLIIDFGFLVLSFILIQYNHRRWTVCESTPQIRAY